ncbi:hypothetical protein Trydic_g21437 [Trypoxylus dichotomus]
MIRTGPIRSRLSFFTNDPHHPVASSALPPFSYSFYKRAVLVVVVTSQVHRSARTERILWLLNGSTHTGRIREMDQARRRDAQSEIGSAALYEAGRRGKQLRRHPSLISPVRLPDIVSGCRGPLLCKQGEVFEVRRSVGHKPVIKYTANEVRGWLSSLCCFSLECGRLGPITALLRPGVADGAALRWKKGGTYRVARCFLLF